MFQSAAVCQITALQHTATHCISTCHRSIGLVCMLRVAVCCSVLQCVVACCSVSNSCISICNRSMGLVCMLCVEERVSNATLTATHCNTLQHTSRHCNTLPHKNSQMPLSLEDTGTHFQKPQHTATHYRTKILKRQHYSPFLWKIDLRAEC